MTQINSANPKIQLAYKLAKNKLNTLQFEHAKRVAKIIQQKQLDDNAIIVAIIHDLLYLKKMTYQEINTEFGEKIANMLKELTLAEEILTNNYSKIPAPTLSSLVLSISSDLQTIIIQIAEIIDLLKNNEANNEDIKKLAKIADEIYYPLTVKLGLGDFSWKLQDYSFKIFNPDGYIKIKELIGKTLIQREEKINQMILELKTLLDNNLEIQIFGRPKNFKSIFLKMNKVPIKKMYDIYGLRIICNKERECYEILGKIHSKYNFIKEAFDDYIIKEGSGVGKGGYQSIHTAIIKGDDVFEIQIRTWQMHLRTESSIYWQYKRLKKDENFEKELSWERQLIEWQKSIGEQNSKRKIISRKIFAFTPKREVIGLTKGATVLDFAFQIHTEIGQRAQKASINGKNVALDAQIENLDTVQIITSNKPTIKKSWLNIVRSEKAKQKIRTYFGIEASKKSSNLMSEKNIKKIKLAECCNPLPGEDVIGVKTTKRKIIIHKKDCPNIKNISKEKLIEIGFEKNSGKTKIRLIAVDRIGLLGEILAEIKKRGIKLSASNFQIKKSGYVEAIFELEVSNIKKLENLLESLEKINSIQSVERQ